MEYVTSIERRGIKKGLQAGGAEIVSLLLRPRFGELDEATQARVSALPAEMLRKLSVALLDFSDLSDLDDWLLQHPLPTAVSGFGENGAIRELGA